LVSAALTLMRLVPIVTLVASALVFGVAASASAQLLSPDETPYPVETAQPSAKRVTKQAAKKPAMANAAPKIAAKAGPGKPEAPKAASAKPAEPAADVFAGIPRDERLKLQAALLWSGDYPGAANSEDPMLAAVTNFQKRKNHKITGALTETERADLLAAAKDYEDEFGWSVVADPATGIRIGLPTKMVPQAHEAEHGTRWSSRHGDVQVETFRFADPDVKLPALFEREKKEPATRRVEYSILRDDSFFISGLQGLKKFSVRATMRDGEVRGFTMMFDQAMESIVTPVMVAMASAFSPFPQRSAPFAALAKSVEYGNGIVVSAQGHIVTDANLVHGCQIVVAAGLGDAERVAENSGNGLALLRVYGPGKFAPASLTQNTGKTADVTLTGIPDPKEHDGGGKLTAIKARLSEANSIELRQPVPMAGFSGAAALDGNGHLIGITELRNAVLASIAPSVPPVRLVRAETIRDFLASQHVPLPAKTADARAAIVRVICVRK
jgi:hypothetical protein